MEAWLIYRVDSGLGLQGAHAPRSQGGERSPHPSLRLSLLATCLSCRWQAVEAGNRAVADWGSGSVLIPCALDDRIG